MISIQFRIKILEEYRFLHPLIASFPRLVNVRIQHDETDMDCYIVPLFVLGCYPRPAASNPRPGAILARAGSDCRDQRATRQPRVGALHGRRGPDGDGARAFAVPGLDQQEHPRAQRRPHAAGIGRGGERGRRRPGLYHAANGHLRHLDAVTGPRAYAGGL